MCIGLNCLWIGAGGGLLWERYWTFFMIRSAVSFSRRTLQNIITFVRTVYCIAVSEVRCVLISEKRINLNSFIHSVFCLTTGPKPPLKRFLHIVRSIASSFKWEYSLLSLRSSSSFLRLLPRLLVTSTSPFIFPSITCLRRQFLRKMWPIQLAFRFLAKGDILKKIKT